MPETIFSFSPTRRIALLIIITLSAIVVAFGQSLNPSAPLLPARLGEQWKAVNEARTLNQEQYSILPNAEVYDEYGLRHIATRDYANGKTKYTVEVFVTSYASGAFGLLSYHRGEIQANRKELQHGRYLISISNGSSGNPIAELDPALVNAIKANLPNAMKGTLPSLPSHLPEPGKIAESVRYLLGPLALARVKGFGDLKDVVKFTSGAEAVAASYPNGTGRMELLIVEYHTPQLASDGFASLQTFFDSLPQSEKEKRLLTRIGNYAVEAVNIQDRPAARSLVGQIKYTQQVYWEGDKISDIPLAYRPTDGVAVHEAMQTANVLIRTFYWIGIMITSALVLGLIAGCSFFYIKRHLRRKHGLDNLFSDAGGTVRLNLDEYLLLASKDAIKKIGKPIGQIDKTDEEV